MENAQQKTGAPENAGVPRHLAIIMDGNGRWAEQRGLARTVGHRQGVETVREIVRSAGELGISYLTLYSFSSENWNRPESEVLELFSLLRLFIRRDLAELHNNNVRVRVIGERAGLPEDIISLLREAELLTQENTGQTLVIAFNYGSRRELVSGFKRLAASVTDGTLDIDEIDEATIASHLDTAGIPDPDLLIRTSGEMRLSNFLLWQLAYTELVFVDCLWPDFKPRDLHAAIDVYRGRIRKFGGLSAKAAR